MGASSFIKTKSIARQSEIKISFVIKFIKIESYKRKFFVYIELIEIATVIVFRINRH